MNAQMVLFYLFSAILVFAALRVVTARNPVHAALWLVLASPRKYQGFVAQEQFDLPEILANRLVSTTRREAPRICPRRSW